MSCVVCMQKEEAQAALINNNMDLRSAIGESHCHMLVLNCYCNFFEVIGKVKVPIVSIAVTALRP